LTYLGNTYIAQEDKARSLKDYYEAQLGQPAPCSHTLDWEELPVPRFDLSMLADDLSEEEITPTVMCAPMEKAPGPDSYIEVFYKKCWDIIKTNVVAALQELFMLLGGCWNLLNSTNVALIPKKEEAQAVTDTVRSVSCIALQS
jgi:hypothetical protein